MIKKFFLLIVIFQLISCTNILSNLAGSLYEQKDIQLVEEGAPSYLLLVEALIRNSPNDKDMLVTGIQLFSAYSGAFVDQKERKAIFNEKTMKWTKDLLNCYPAYRKYSSLKEAEKSVRDKAYDDFVKSITKNDVKYLFWAAYSWALNILANVDNPDVFIELPYVKSILKRIYDLDSGFYYGAPHLIEGIFYGAYPEAFGGNLAKAKIEFEKALELSQGKLFMIKLFYADFYYKPQMDREGYEKLLKEVIDADVDRFPENRLMNILAQKDARLKLSKVEEVFSDDFQF